MMRPAEQDRKFVADFLPGPAQMVVIQPAKLFVQRRHLRLAGLNRKYGFMGLRVYGNNEARHENDDRGFG